MTDDDDEYTPVGTAEPKRAKDGRYLIVPPGGGKEKAHTRATTWAKTIEDTHKLEEWERRMVALGLAARPDLMVQVKSLSAAPEHKQDLNGVCRDAKAAAKADARSNLGTALHRFVYRINRGETLAVPAPYDRDVDVYHAARAAAGIRAVPGMAELTVVNPALGSGVAGMFDELALYGADPLPVVGDLKTGRDLDYGQMAIAAQLATYANSETVYDHTTCTHRPMPPVNRDKGIILHLPAGEARCVVYEVDLVAGWEIALLIGRVRKERNRKHLFTTVVEWPPATIPADPEFDVDTPADPERREQTAARARLLVNVMGLGPQVAAAWPAGVPGLKGDHPHTPAELDLIGQALDAVEAAAAAPPHVPTPDSPTEPDGCDHGDGTCADCEPHVDPTPEAEQLRMLAAAGLIEAPTADPGGNEGSRTPTRTDIVARLEWLKAEHPDHFPAVAAAWPTGVPGLRSDHQHTPGELAAILDACKTVEEHRWLTYPPDPAYAPDLAAPGEARAADRTEQDTADAASRQAREDQKTEHKTNADNARQLIGAYADKAYRAMNTVAENDWSICEAISGAAGFTVHDKVDADRWRNTQAVVAALDNGILTLIATDGGFTVAAGPDAERLIAATAGGKASAAARARQWAPLIDVRVPRSAARIADTPLLAALVATGPPPAGVDAADTDGQAVNPAPPEAQQETQPTFSDEGKAA